jgi:hypothetical protein
MVRCRELKAAIKCYERGEGNSLTGTRFEFWDVSA